MAYRHPILDKKFNVRSDEQILSDGEVKELIQSYVSAAQVAWECGADFVDIKHCHGYLLHEFLSAFTRAGEYGGCFENRTRILREIVQGIRASGNKIELGVRLSAFDSVPFKPDPSRAEPGKLGPGIPDDFPLPYPYAFGCDANNPLEYDLTETFQFMQLCRELGIKILNLSAGSPYYNPHIQRPAAYPPSDGYQPAHDPLIDVARQIEVVRQLKAKAPAGIGVDRLGVQLFAGIPAERGAGSGAGRMGGHGRTGANYTELSDDGDRSNDGRAEIAKVDLPDVQRLHHRAAERNDQRLFSARRALRRQTGSHEA